MPRTESGDHNPSPTNTTFTERRKARDAAGIPEAPRRPRALRAGADAETEFEIVHTTTGGANRVHTLNT